jgi:hypothetical protein
MAHVRGHRVGETLRDIEPPVIGHVDRTSFPSTSNISAPSLAAFRPGRARLKPALLDGGGIRAPVPAVPRATANSPAMRRRPDRVGAERQRRRDVLPCHHQVRSGRQGSKIGGEPGMAAI